MSKWKYASSGAVAGREYSPMKSVGMLLTSTRSRTCHDQYRGTTPVVGAVIHTLCSLLRSDVLFRGQSRLKMALSSTPDRGPRQPAELVFHYHDLPCKVILTESAVRPAAPMRVIQPPTPGEVRKYGSLTPSTQRPLVKVILVKETMAVGGISVTVEVYSVRLPRSHLPGNHKVPRMGKRHLHIPSPVQLTCAMTPLLCHGRPTRHLHAAILFVFKSLVMRSERIGAPDGKPGASA